MPLFLDLPEPQIEQTDFAIAGWVAGDSPNVPVRVSINGRRVPHSLQESPGLSAALPGFAFVRRVVAHGHVVDCGEDAIGEIDLQFGEEAVKKHVSVAPGLYDVAAREMRLREKTRAWCEANLQCPVCASRGLRVAAEHVTCRFCGVRIPQGSRALDLISPGLRLQASLVDTTNVSNNPYTPLALELINKTVRKGGWVLDCGAGSRAERIENVVNVEIVDYSSTDVLAIGEALPFADESFDAVLSLAVLEHVRDPFKCAQELMRVLKPGGNIVADVPFLQPVHGYPNHFYNMTRTGLTSLFDSGGEIIACYTPTHGHPIWTMQWFTSAYLHGLPPDIREQFGHRTLFDVAKPVGPSDLVRPEVNQLDSNAMEVLACLNTVVVRKHVR